MTIGDPPPAHGLREPMQPPEEVEEHRQVLANQMMMIGGLLYLLDQVTEHRQVPENQTTMTGESLHLLLEPADLHQVQENQPMMTGELPLTLGLRPLGRVEEINLGQAEARRLLLLQVIRGTLRRPLKDLHQEGTMIGALLSAHLELRHDLVMVEEVPARAVAVPVKWKWVTPRRSTMNDRSNT